MSDVTVKHLASTVGIPVERLLAQLHEAGITAAGEEARLTEQEKLQLLGYLRRSHGKQEAEEGTAPSRVTLKRRSVSELRQPVASGRTGGGIRAATAPRAKTVSVEVRRKRTYIKRAAATTEAGPEPEMEDAAERELHRPLAEAQDRGQTSTTDVRRRTELEARRAEEEARRLAEQEEEQRKAREEEAQ
ncbi:MAG: translation initiation factor IF-2 associated domain-containing protein, partial [Pseudomonadota bacterium]|nr:translation initiation factor IF-2 associated domain-containing protein [Pseudomonadota bacterium]